ncbi:hypothetical protein VNI00_008470 [Paramarasmius palmivorus]|uniref:F-box protein n=1 Tax=Paramarasmius palmivorus TaxID=297713 RepID=A0AAW0CTD3_9AGAR
MPLGRIAVTDDDEDYRSLWVDEKILPLLLRLLTHLKRFEIASRQGNTSWHTLSSLLLDAFEELFQRLDYIRIKAWDFPQMESFDKLLHHCPNLKGLTLWKSRIGPADSYDRSPEEYDDGDEKDSEIALDSPSPDLDIIHKHSAILLEFLTLDYVECAYLGDWLLNRPHLVHLNGIHELRIAHSNDKSVQRLLRAVGGSLQRFHFKPGPIGLQRLDLSHNTSLRCVWLTLEEDSGMLPWISALLSTAPNLDGLERVVLELYTDPKRLEIEDWRTLHKVCSEAPRATINIGIFASPNSVEFLQIQEEMSTVVSESESTPRVRVYQLGTKRQGSICAGMIPVIEKFEDDFGRRMSGSHGHGHF